MTPYARSKFLSAAVLLAVAFSSATAAAAHPNFTGMWILAPGEYDGAGAAIRHEVMPLTPLGQELQDAGYHAVEQDQKVLSEANRRCLPIGMPDIMGNEFAMEVLDTGDRVTILSENSPAPRSVYLDETSHPTGLEPSWNGHSIGRWVGDVLVADTVNFNDRKSAIAFSGGVRSPTTHVVEHFHMENDGKTLIDDMTFEDPRYLKRAWTKRHVYNRLPKGSELWEYVCEVDAAGWSERYAGDPQAHVGTK